MALSCTSYSFYLWVAIVSMCVLKLTTGQVGECTGMGCNACTSYKCCLKVEENSMPGTHIGLASIDTDLMTVFINQSMASYTISDNLFSIDSDTGNITTTTNLDRESTACYRVAVNVVFSGGSASNAFAIEIIDTNDNRPFLPISTISIRETTATNPQINCQTQPTKSALATLAAIDNDTGMNAMIMYSISDSAIFSIPDPSVLCINNSAPLDRDAPDYQPYSFTLVATDMGVPPLSTSITVTLNLTNVNDNMPEFQTNGTFTVREDSQVGMLIHQFQAVDSDIGANGDAQRIQYSIDISPLPFVLNSSTGEMRLSSALDAEVQLVYSFTVLATNEEEMGNSIAVTINVQDINEPSTFSLSKTSISVPENIIGSTEVISVSIHDGDITISNNNNSPMVVSGEEFFVVVTIVSSIMVVQQIKVIDRERNSSLDIVVRLLERGDPEYNNQTRTVRVTVEDENDNAPYLNTKSFQYVENSVGFQKITCLKDHIFDQDVGRNAEVKSIELLTVYNGVNVSFIDRFMPYNEYLSDDGLLQAPPLDREMDGDVFTFNIYITDNGEPSQSKIAVFTVYILDLNDNAPEFQSSVYNFTIRENQPTTAVGTVEALDPDERENGTVTYSLQSSADSQFFTINPNTGVISNLYVFDRENRSSYVVNVDARDNSTEPRSARNSAVVHIKIADVNDNYPSFIETSIFTFTIPTSLQVGKSVGAVQAVDADEGSNGIIVYKLEQISNYFEINTMGIITLNQSLTEAKMFNLSVIACDVSSCLFNTTAIVLISVEAQSLLQMNAIIAIAAGSAGCVFVLFIFAVCILVICFRCYRHRCDKAVITEPGSLPNNKANHSDSLKKPILKPLPAAIGSQLNRGRVQFVDKVEETHYDQHQAVTGDTVLRKESTTNFGSSDESLRLAGDRGPPVQNGGLQSAALPVVDLEMSPTGKHMNNMNGNIGGNHVNHSRYEMRHLHPHSPLHHRKDMPDHADLDEYSHSQGTCSTVTTDEANSYNSVVEDDSTFSSNMNTSIPRFETDDHSPELHRFVPPPSHPAPLHLHSHTLTTHMSSPSHLEQLHAHNLASLAAAADASYRSSQENDLTPTHSHNHSHHSSLSSQTHPISRQMPGHPIITRMNPPHVRPMHMHSNGHNHPHPLVMPDAYPRVGLPDIRRYPHEPYNASFSDYGDASTYASTELDEALDFNFEAEPNFCSLTATDYDENEGR